MKATHVHPQSLDPGLYAGLVIVAAFITTRVLFYGLGGRFIAQPVGFAMQYLDPQLLQNDLQQSLLYLHIQPPLFNLFLGIVLNDHWVLPPLILPDHFDPDEYFKPFLKAAESKAKKFDEAIGKLQRAWSTMSKASEAKENAAEPSLVQERIDIEKQTIRDITKWLSNSFLAIRDKRYAMHDVLREKMKKDSSIGRFERFQEPEIIWKYLDRAGYNDFLWKIHKLYSDNRLEKILTTY